MLGRADCTGSEATGQGDWKFYRSKGDIIGVVPVDPAVLEPALKKAQQAGRQALK